MFLDRIMLHTCHSNHYMLWLAQVSRCESVSLDIGSIAPILVKPLLKPQHSSPSQHTSLVRRGQDEDRTSNVNNSL